MIFPSGDDTKNTDPGEQDPKKQNIRTINDRIEDLTFENCLIVV